MWRLPSKQSKNGYPYYGVIIGLINGQSHIVDREKINLEGVETLKQRQAHRIDIPPVSR